MLSAIAAVLLTFNEAPNIGRTLACLTWAKDIVVVDTGSTDDTASIVAAFPQVRVFHRPFDTHGNQWRYATQETGISTDWILRLDADYEVTEALKDELSRLDANADVDAYRISFRLRHLWTKIDLFALPIEYHPACGKVNFQSRTKDTRRRGRCRGR